MAERAKVELRPMAAGDVEEVAALARRIWNAHYPGIISQRQIDYMLEQRYNRQRLLDELGRPEVSWELAIADGRCVGFASTLLIAGAGGRELKLDKLYVESALQRQGVGGRLIESAARRARALGAAVLLLAVNKRNEDAIAAYRKHGFAVREAVCVDIGDGFVMDDFIMQRTV